MKKLFKYFILTIPFTVYASQQASKTYFLQTTASSTFIKLIKKYDESSNSNREENRKELLNLSESMKKSLRLQNIKNMIYKMESTSDFIYRLEWMITALQTFEVNDSQKKNLSFEHDCKLNFDTVVDQNYLNINIQDLHSKLKALLPDSDSKIRLCDKLQDYKKGYMIPKSKYEEVFRRLVDEVLSLTKIEETKSAKVVQEYVDKSNLSYEASCEPIGKGVSKMLVNIARPVSYDKAQQLAAHELTHHIQFTLMGSLVEKFPEMKLIMELTPLSMLLEGGAEYAVDLIYPRETRLNSLKKLLGKEFSDDKLKNILDIEQITWKESWRTVIYLSKKYLNKDINKTEFVVQLEELAFKPNNSWPNADFIESSRAYIQSYGWGRELIESYLKAHNKNNWKGYVEFMKRPIPPSKMQEFILKSKNIN